MIWLFTGFVAFVITSLFVLSIRSRRPPPLGIVSGRLRTCPTLPNCICTEDSGAPVQLTGSAPQAWQQAQQIIRDLGGRIDRIEPHYLHATFTTRLWRFVDDFELRLDEPAGLIHIRSSARVGQRDFGVNRKRVETFRARFR